MKLEKNSANKHMNSLNNNMPCGGDGEDHQEADWPTCEIRYLG